MVTYRLSVQFYFSIESYAWQSALSKAQCLTAGVGGDAQVRARAKIILSAVYSPRAGGAV